jgi:hypothetical protein
MKSALKFAAFAGIAVLALGSLSPADTSSTSAHSKKKAAKVVVLPPLPSGPQGPVPQIPLDSIAPVPPQVSYQNGQLTIVAPNSTLADILRAVRKQTSADIEVPPATERVVTHLGPGPAREIVAELLNGSRFNYVLLGSPQDATALTRVVLVAKSGPDNIAPVAGQPQPQQPQGNMAPPPQDPAPDAADAPDAAEENPDENADQNAAAEAEQQQQGPPPDAPGIKTPQQMLQEMQQRQLQLQQNQPPGQPPIPGGGFPGRPTPPGQQPEQQQ